MIQLEQLALSSGTLKSLKRYQTEIDSESDFPSKVEKAKGIWPSRSRNQPFNEVKQKLTRMCAGARRCCYCEDSVADEVEHIFPKSLYPEKTFIWENYLYACGPCNGPKNNKFSVFDSISQDIIDVTPEKDEVPSSPLVGNPVLINPREENPLDYLFLDLVNTFHFVEWPDDPSTQEYQRASFTIDILRLNTRDYLTQARKEAYSDYRARLIEYIQRRDSGAPKTELNNMIEGILTKQHPTVWEEMKRQNDKIPELKGLFEQVPEALNW